MSNKKVLIITYYWPPSGGAGVQRWLKFVKYLPQHGWDPIVYTTENGEYPVLDHQLIKEIPENIEVIKTPIWEPYGLYKKLSGRKQNDNINSGFLSENKKRSKLIESISVWVRGNLFIPDARKFWIKPSVKFLSNYLKENKVDAIISSGPPHSMHLIALALKKKFNIPWIADFRDPWTNIDYYQDLKLSKRSDQKHKKLEKNVLLNADITLSVGKTLAKELQALGSNNVQIIENGYDPEDFNLKESTLDEKFTIAHIGSFTPSRNHPILWESIKELIKENKEFADHLQLKLIGKIDYSVKESIEENSLSEYVNFMAYLPHDQVIKEQSSSHVLLLMVNNTPNAKGIVTGKVFEYMASSRPILVIGPKDGDLAQIINESNTGIVCDYNEKQKLKSTLLELYHQKIKLAQTIEKYSRTQLTQKLSKLLNDII